MKRLMVVGGGRAGRGRGRRRALEQVGGGGRAGRGRGAAADCCRPRQNAWKKGPQVSRRENVPWVTVTVCSRGPGPKTTGLEGLQPW